MNEVNNVIIADDHLLFADGLEQLLNKEDDIHVQSIANNGRTLIDQVRNSKPHIILLDINMPLLNGLDALKRLKQDYPEIKIIILSTYGDNHLIEKAKNNGANGYLLKNANKDELLQTIRLVASGQTSFPYRKPMVENMMDEDSFIKKNNLTKKEYEIIQYIKQGLTNAQIAEKNFLSIYTVETHRKNIMRKLKLNNPAALMKFILENEL